MTSHPKVRSSLQGKKRMEWGKKRYLLTVFAAGNPRDKCKNHKMNRFWMISGFTLCCTQYNQRFSVIKIRPHTDAKTDLHIERVKKHLDSYYKICKFFQTHISHNIFQTSMRQNMPNTFKRNTTSSFKKQFKKLT